MLSKYSTVAGLDLRGRQARCDDQYVLSDHIGRGAAEAEFAVVGVQAQHIGVAAHA